MIRWSNIIGWWNETNYIYIYIIQYILWDMGGLSVWIINRYEFLALWILSRSKVQHFYVGSYLCAMVTGFVDAPTLYDIICWTPQLMISSWYPMKSHCVPGHVLTKLLRLRMFKGQGASMRRLVLICNHPRKSWLHSVGICHSTFDICIYPSFWGFYAMICTTY